MNDKLDEILRKLNLIEKRLDILETAMFGLDDEEIKQHNEIM